MSYQNMFKRYEIKYLITKNQKQELLKIMKNHMEPDKFGKSTICNIYFDTPNNLLIRRSLDKPCYKEKLRVRSYGVAKPDSRVFVEIKKKYKSVVYKRRIAMAEKEMIDYLINGNGLSQVTQISKEIDYFIKMYENIEKAMFLSYKREAFFSKTDKNLRITFDENILARDYDISLISGVYGEKILEEGMVLLEVKTALGIPIWLLEFLSENKIYKRSFSKYGEAYKQILLPRFTRGKGNVA